jgi:hypothetical protein
MKVVGIMLAKDEADILPEVLEDLTGRFDALYAYEDGSIDDTRKILKSSPVVTYLMTKDDDVGRLPIKRPMHHHLLEKIKEDYRGCGEPVWVVISEADRFFLNKYPRQIAEEAQAAGCTSVSAVQLDFLRHRADPWTRENDTFPDYPKSLREICKWFKFDEKCVIAYLLTEDISYLEAKYPWPRGAHSKMMYPQDEPMTREVPFVEHQGRRSPNAFKWRIESGSRPLSSKTKLPSTSFEDIQSRLKKWYDQYKLCPWVNVDSLDQFLIMNEEEEWKKKAKKVGYWTPLEEGIIANGSHRREDI